MNSPARGLVVTPVAVANALRGCATAYRLVQPRVKDSDNIGQQQTQYRATQRALISTPMMHSYSVYAFIEIIASLNSLWETLPSPF